jgi:hypothetical protein
MPGLLRTTLVCLLLVGMVEVELLRNAHSGKAFCTEVDQSTSVHTKMG